MAEVAQEWVHPVFKLSMDDLLAQCPDEVLPLRL